MKETTTKLIAAAKKTVGVVVVASGSLLSTCGPISSCFVRGTRVATPRGHRNIESLRIDDIVWSWAIADARPVERRLTRVLASKRTEVLAMRSGESRIAGVTPEHPVFDADLGDFVPAAELSLRRRVLRWTGEGPARVDAIDVLERLPSRGEIEVWDLSVDGPEHNFFAEGLLVHNKTPDAGPLRIDSGTDGGAPDARAP
jgi:hypothetical protein